MNYKRNICRFCGLLTAVFAIIVAACGETAVSPESLVVTREPLAVTHEPLTVTHEPLADPTITISRSHSITPTPSLTPPSPTPTPDPYADLTIDALTARSYGGGELDILEILEETETF
ncbi:MAG: hypothetical protein GY943_38145, partial [Chloroflexi bacterium]|nr:hypothetical protein [Chloroflexota bacterium]